MNYIAIDFSINSPGICVYRDSDDTYTFISYIKPKTGTKAERALQDQAAELDSAVFIEQPVFETSNEFSSKELLKINRYETMASEMSELIIEAIDPETPSVIGFEGSSYGSAMGTNNLIDMASAATLLKVKLLKELEVRDMRTVAPSTIKKHAGKGNMKKSDLWKVFLQNTIKDVDLLNSDFYLFCVEEIGEVSKVPKPFDDLVDAYFLCNFLMYGFTTQT